MQLDETVVAAMEAAVLCWCATADAEGFPNVSPKELFAPGSSYGLIIADIASPQTVANLRVNPNICVSFVDIFRQTGFKLKGKAVILGPDHPGFADIAAPLLRRAGDRFPIRNLICVDVHRMARIVAPSYFLFPEMSVDDRVAEAMQSYGVRLA